MKWTLSGGILCILLTCGCSALQQFATMSMQIDPQLAADAESMDLRVSMERDSISGLAVGDFVVSDINTEFSKKSGYDFGFTEKKEGEFEFMYALTQGEEQSGEVICQGRYHLNRTQSDYFRIQHERGDVVFVCANKDTAEDTPEWRLALKGLTRANLNGRYQSDGHVYRVRPSTTHKFRGLKSAMVMGYHIYDGDTVVAAVETAAVKKRLWVAPSHRPVHQSLARTASALVLMESLVPQIGSALGR